MLFLCDNSLLMLLASTKILESSVPALSQLELTVLEDIIDRCNSRQCCLNGLVYEAGHLHTMLTNFLEQFGNKLIVNTTAERLDVAKLLSRLCNAETGLVFRPSSSSRRASFEKTKNCRTLRIQNQGICPLSTGSSFLGQSPLIQSRWPC